MVTITQKPIFCVVLDNGQRWTVEAEWPDGTIEQIVTFRGYLEALTWVSNRAEAWLQGRTDLDDTPKQFRSSSAIKEIPGSPRRSPKTIGECD